MSVSQVVYAKSPVILQNIFVSIYGLKRRIERAGKVFNKHKNFLRHLESASYEELQRVQNEEFMKLFEYARTRSEFYKRLYNGIEVKSINDIYKLPIVTKDMLRGNIEEVYTVSKLSAIEGHTGGTTGKSLVVRARREDIQKGAAILELFKESHGFKSGMPKATFSGKHLVPEKDKTKKIFWRHNIFANQRFYSTFDISDENLSYYVEDLNRFKPKALDGFISSISEVANYIIRNDIKLSFSPIAIFTTAETVTPEKRKMIEDAFGCKLRDQYASSEGAPVIYECTSGKYHFRMDTGIIETPFADEEAVVTSFLTYGTPLIRYAIGDSIQFDSSIRACSCGSNHPIVESILGRKDDYLLATNGAKINLGNISNAFKNIPNAVVNAQIVQKAWNYLEVRIIIDKTRYKREFDSLIIREFKSKFGEGMNVVIQKVSDIERAPSGKYKFIIRKMDSNTKVTV